MLKMHIRKWEELPEFMKNEQVKKYYEHIKKHQFSLFFKRCFDLIMGILLLIVLSPILLLVTIWIKLDSPGPAFFRQVRVTQYGKEVRIFKFRSMIIDAPNKGSAVTKANDDRITKSGHFIRKTRLDERPQLLKEDWYDNFITSDDQNIFDDKDKEIYYWITWQDLQEKEMTNRLIEIRGTLWC